MNKKEKYIIYVAQKCDKIKEELTDKLDTENTNKVFELLVLTRSLAVNIIEQYVTNKSELNQIDRKIKKYYNITGKNEKTLTELSKACTSANKVYLEMLVTLGKNLWLILDLWKVHGGNFEKLCNICNISHEKGLELTKELEEHSFAEYIFIATLDYKNKGDFIEETPDAPLTSCIMRYMMDQISNTEKGSKFAREAFVNVFGPYEGSETNENKKGI